MSAAGGSLSLVSTAQPMPTPQISGTATSTLYTAVFGISELQVK